MAIQRSAPTLNHSDFAGPKKDNYGYLYLVDGNIITEQHFLNLESATYHDFYSQLAKAIAGEGPPPIIPKKARNII